MKNIGLPPTVYNNEYIRFYQVVTMNILLYPGALLKRLSALRYLSLLGFFMVLFTIAVLVVQSGQYHEANYDPETFLIVDFNITTIQSFAVCMFSYCCHTSVLKVKSELTNPTPKRMNKIFFRVIMLSMLAYLLMAVFGYWNECQNTPSMIIMRR